MRVFACLQPRPRLQDEHPFAGRGRLSRDDTSAGARADDAHVGFERGRTGDRRQGQHSVRLRWSGRRLVADHGPNRVGTFGARQAVEHQRAQALQSAEAKGDRRDRALDQSLQVSLAFVRTHRAEATRDAAQRQIDERGLE